MNELIRDLHITVGMEYDNYNGITEFDLQYKEERDYLYSYLDEHSETYSVAYFDSEVFQHDDNTDLYEVLETVHTLTKLSTKEQRLFADVFVNGYTDSPMSLANQILNNLRD